MALRSRAAYSRQSYTGEGVWRRIAALNSGSPICSTVPLVSVRTITVGPVGDSTNVVTPLPILAIWRSMPSVAAAWRRSDVRYSLPAMP